MLPGALSCRVRAQRVPSCSQPARPTIFPLAQCSPQAARAWRRPRRWRPRLKERADAQRQRRSGRNARSSKPQPGTQMGKPLCSHGVVEHSSAICLLTTIEERDTPLDASHCRVEPCHAKSCRGVHRFFLFCLEGSHHEPSLAHAQGVWCWASFAVTGVLRILTDISQFCQLSCLLDRTNGAMSSHV